MAVDPVIESTAQILSLSVNEVFGPTIQGEGPSQGRPVVFVRLGLCNLDCRWCDTPYTWDWTGKNGRVYDKAMEVHTRTIVDVIDDVVSRATINGELAVTRVVVSGGEPLIQQRRLAHLVEGLVSRGITTEIETNGTITPKDDHEINLVDLAHMGIVAFNVSPKLANSGVEQHVRLVPEALEVLVDLPSVFKFVVASDDDIIEVDHIVARYLPTVAPERIYLMPEGTEKEAISQRLPWVFDWCARRGWGLSPRLHVLAHGNTRGI